MKRTRINKVRIKNTNTGRGEKSFLFIIEKVVDDNNSMWFILETFEIDNETREVGLRLTSMDFPQLFSAQTALGRAVGVYSSFA